MKISRLEMLTFRAQLTAQVPLMFSLWRVEFRYCCRLGGHDSVCFRHIIVYYSLCARVCGESARAQVSERKREQGRARWGMGAVKFTGIDTEAAEVLELFPEILANVWWCCMPECLTTFSSPFFSLRL